MALQLSMSNPYDVTPAPAAYCRVVVVHIDVGAQSVRIDSVCYLSAAARASGVAPFTGTSYTVTGADFTTYFSDAALALATPIASAYAYLKSLMMYKTALSV